MPHSVRHFDIHNCDVTPRGNNAHMSKSNTTYPDQGQWKNNDPHYDYTINLTKVPAVWELAAGQPACSNSLIFTLTKNQTSCIYQVLPGAPPGPSSYTVTRSDGQVCQYRKDKLLQDPDVIIDA